MSNVTITLKNVWSRIDGLNEIIINALDKELSYAVPNAHFAIEQMPWWDGRIRLFKKVKNNDKSIDILTGLTAKTILFLYENFKIKTTVIDTRKKPEKELFLQWSDKEKFKLRDYQNEAVENALKKGRGVIEAATGAGKTTIVAKIIRELGVKPFIFYVMSKELLYQAKDTLEEAMPDLSVGVIGDGICDIKDINVMTIQTACTVYDIDIKKDLKKMGDFDESELDSIKKENMTHIEKAFFIKKLIEKCQGIYFDECHHIAAKTAESIIKKSSNCYYLFGGSATPIRSDNADLYLEGLLGRKLCKIDASFLIRKGFLMKPDIYYIKLKSPAIKTSNFNEDIKENIVNNKERNEHISSIALSLAESNLSVLILVSRIEHGEILKKMIKGSEFVYSKSKNRKEIFKQLEKKEIHIVLSSSLADEGLDLPTLNCVILAGGGKSPTKCKQRVGRAIRKTAGKIYSVIFDFLDVGIHTKKHSRARKKFLEQEPEFNIIEIASFEKANCNAGKNLF